MAWQWKTHTCVISFPRIPIQKPVRPLAMYLIKTKLVVAWFCLSTCCLAQQDSTDLRNENWDIFPMISSSPETGLLLGANPVLTFKTGSSYDSLLQPSFLNAQLFGTFKKQFGIMTQGNLFFLENKYIAEFTLSGTINVWRYYGIGNEIDIEQYDSYDFRAFSGNVVLLRQVIPKIYAGVGYRYNHQYIPTPSDGGLLDTERPRGYRGFTASGPAAVLRWDSRDNILNAYRGSFLNLRGELHRTALGSSHPFEVFIADFRKYIPLSEKAFHVLAFQLLHQATFGQVPFAELSMLGGSMINRGYFQGAYRDRHTLSIQAEYREMIWKNFGAVFFASAGNTMPAYDDLKLGETKFALGAGLRFALLPENRINLRLDFAWGEDSQGIYVGIAESF